MRSGGRWTEGKVFFPGPLYGDDKAAALQEAEVFVLPSLNENFGVAAAEAMACGTPVICIRLEHEPMEERYELRKCIESGKYEDALLLLDEMEE